MGRGGKKKHIDIGTQLRFDEKGEIFDPVVYLRELFKAVTKLVEEKRGEEKKRPSSPESFWWTREPDERGRRL